MNTKQKLHNPNQNRNLPSDRPEVKLLKNKKFQSLNNLNNIRIIKKNLVYVIGITKEMASKNVTNIIT